MNLKRVLTPSINWVFQKSSKKSGPLPSDGNKHRLFVHIHHGSDIKKFESIIRDIQKTFVLTTEVDDVIKRKEATSIIKGVDADHFVYFCELHPNLKFDGYSWARDLSGTLYHEIKSKKYGSLHFQIGANLKVNSKSKVSAAREFYHSIATGLVVGLENASYAFLPVLKDEDSISKVPVHLNLEKTVANVALVEAASLKLARHLVNLPPNHLDPQSFSDLITKQMPFSGRSKIEVWDASRCKKERMNLLLAVGAGSESQSRLVHVKYRPAKSGKKKPIAFVGKGITFDTGGLDIKPSAGMRLMKKDMGGSASVLALAHFVDQVQLSQPCDFYLALAENSVDSKSMRPSDIYQSRAGYWVEIDNTDAEGRLVLADAMNVALTQKETPTHLIDVATLTGAIKVGLGADIGGLFTNDDDLADELHWAGEMSGEPNWRMPLHQKYRSQLNSSFADFRNSADGFGGAITAALFLEKFASLNEAKTKINPKWAHLDVYCWNDKPNGAIQTVGGSGQPVQTLIRWLKEFAKR